jgi:hypothetical protein
MDKASRKVLEHFAPQLSQQPEAGIYRLPVLAVVTLSELTFVGYLTPGPWGYSSHSPLILKATICCICRAWLDCVCH